MTRKQVEATKWAKAVKTLFPARYEEVIDIAVNKDSIFIIYQANVEFEKCWVISYSNSPESIYEIWMNVFKTKKTAVEFCRKMGWKIKKG